MQGWSRLSSGFSFTVSAVGPVIGAVEGLARYRTRRALCRRGASEIGDEELAGEICDLVGLFFEGEVAAV